MKKIIAIIFLIQSLGMNSQDFYYFKEVKTEINKLDNKAYLQYSNFDIEKEKSYLAKQGWEIVKWNVREGNQEFESFDKSKTSSTYYEVYIESKSDKSMLPKKDNIIYAEFYYIYKNSEIVPTQLFYVELKDNADFELLQKYANEFDVEILGNNKFMPEFYTLRTKKPVNSIDLSIKFHETNQFASCEPSFVYINPFSCTNDPSFGDLWGLKNTGQSGGVAGIDVKACNAWTTTKGNSNVVVAVIDEGIERTHVDLAANIHPLSFNAITNSSPSIVLGPHGTHCAGTVGAVGNNSIGVVGVAPNVKLMSINVQWGFGVEQILANGINLGWKNGASVLSNSWGGGAPSSIIQSAILGALNNGRNGAGCVVVFAAGNNNSSVISPANNFPEIIVVGSITRNGLRSSFSNYGPELDIVAPGSEVLSTVLNNGYGYNSGTSMATPHVSGIAALILSVNPCLSQRAVHDIICKSGQKVGGYQYNLTSRDPKLGSWNNQMGHGLVDAEACIQLANNPYYLQNTTETSTKSYLYRKILAGSNVDPSSPSGQYIVETNANITLNATESITLSDGFMSKTGSNLLAMIAPSNACNFSNPILKLTKVENQVNEITKKEDIITKSPSINVYPNPTNDVVKIEFETKEKAKIQLFVSDLQGKIVFKDEFNKEAGSHNEEIAGFEKLEKGIYLMRICINKDCQTIKIVKEANSN